MFFDSDSPNAIQISYSNDADASMYNNDIQLSFDSNVPVDPLDFGTQIVYRDGSASYDFECSSSVNESYSSFFADESVPRGYCDALNFGALSINHDEIMSRVDVVPSSSTMSFAQPLSATACFAPGFHPLHGKVVEPPLLPFSPMSTLFSCCRPSSEVVTMINAILDEMDSNLKSTFVPHEFSWDCSFVSGVSHVDFCVRVFRYQKSHSLHGQFAVEFQRIEGDRLPFMNIFNAARDLLLSGALSPEDIQDFMINRCRSGVFTSCVSAFDLNGIVSQAPPAKIPDTLSSPSVNETAAQMKANIIPRLENPRTYACLLESIQTVSSLYSSLMIDSSSSVVAPPSSSQSTFNGNTNSETLPGVDDVAIFKALCAVASHYSSNSADWVYKHAIIAVADMLATFDSKSFMKAMNPSEHDSVVTLLRVMAGCSDNNPFLVSKTELISRVMVGV